MALAPPSVLARLQRRRHDPAEALVLVLDPAELWSSGDSRRAEAALAAIPDDLGRVTYEEQWHVVLAGQTRELETPWHRHRLAQLVAQVRAQLPLENLPRATAVLFAACREFERSSWFRWRVAAFLLAESVERLRSARAA